MKPWIITAMVVVVVLSGCGLNPQSEYVPDPDTFVIFHINSGPMCLALLDWLAETRAEYPGLVVEEHSPYEPTGAALLARLMQQLPASQGVSTSYAYLPIVFFRGQAFSGFNDEIARTLEELLVAAEAAP